MWGVGAVAALSPLSVLAAPTAWVAGAEVSLDDRTGSSDCPGTEKFANQVRAQLSPQARVSKSKFSFRVVLEPSGNTVRGEVEALGPGGQVTRRQLVGERCPEVTDGLALVVAQSIEPMAARPPAVTEAPEPKASPPPPGAPSRWMLRLELSPGILTQVFPQTAATLGVAGELAVSSVPVLRAGVAGRVLFPVTQRVEPGQVQYTGFSAGGWLCATNHADFELSGCGALWTFWLLTDAEGFSLDGSTRAVVPAPGAFVALRRRVIGQLRVGLSVVGYLLLARPQWQVEGLGAVHRPSPVAAAGNLLLNYRF